MTTRAEKSDAKLVGLANELAMALALRSKDTSAARLATLTGLPPGLVAGLTAHGKSLLSGVVDK